MIKKPKQPLFKLLLLSVLLLNSSVLLAESAGLQQKINACQQFVKAFNYVEALNLSKSLIKQNKSLREPYICKAKAEIGLNQDAEALKSLEQGLERSKQPLDKMVTLTLMGNAALNLDQFAEAKNYFQSVLDIAEKEKDKGFKRIALSLLGAAEYKQKNNQLAINHYIESLKLAANDNERADIYSHIAEIYASQQSFDSAIEYQLKATIALKHYGDVEKQVESELLLAEFYVNAKHYEQAKSLYEKLTKFSLENNSPYYAAKSYLGLAKNALANNQQSEAKKHLDEAKKQNSEMNDEGLSQEIIKILNDIPK
jgi:tetratricopeptide (TPR) repeat protein